MDYLYDCILKSLAYTDGLVRDSEIAVSNKYEYIIVSVPKKYGKKIMVNFCDLVCKYVTAEYILDNTNHDELFVVQFKLKRDYLDGDFRGDK
jgi:hypothetical protein